MVKTVSHLHFGDVPVHKVLPSDFEGLGKVVDLLVGCHTLQGLRLRHSVIPNECYIVVAALYKTVLFQ